MSIGTLIAVVGVVLFLVVAFAFLFDFVRPTAVSLGEAVSFTFGGGG